MRKIVFLLILPFFFSCSNEPPLISVTPTEVDLGEIDRFENSSRTFEVTIKNIGGKPLHIKSISRDCESCTSVELEDSIVRSGSESQLQITFESKYFFAGPIEKSVYINSDAQNMSEVIVHFSADLK